MSSHKEIAIQWAEKNLPADLTGKALFLVDLESDEDVHFFFQDRGSVMFQKMVNEAIRRIAANRGLKKAYKLIVSPAEFRHWLGSRLDSPELRAEFINSQYRIQDL